LSLDKYQALNVLKSWERSSYIGWHAAEQHGEPEIEVAQANDRNECAVPEVRRSHSRTTIEGRLFGGAEIVSRDAIGKDRFRIVVLHGRNVAFFKVALAKSVLSLAESGAITVSPRQTTR
jgi:hypothetical protein